MEQLSEGTTKGIGQDVSQDTAQHTTQHVTIVSTQGITEDITQDRSAIDDVIQLPAQDHNTQDSSDDGILDDEISGGNHDGDDALLGDDSELDYNEDIDDDHHDNSDDHHDNSDDNREEPLQELPTPVSITCLTG